MSSDLFSITEDVKAVKVNKGFLRRTFILFTSRMPPVLKETRDHCYLPINDPLTTEIGLSAQRLAYDPRSPYEVANPQLLSCARGVVHQFENPVTLSITKEKA